MPRRSVEGLFQAEHSKKLVTIFDGGDCLQDCLRATRVRAEACLYLVKSVHASEDLVHSALRELPSV